MFTVRPLGVPDVDAYIAIRREMLHDSPWAFAASPESDRGLNAGHLASSLAGPGFAIVGAFEDAARLIGTVGLVRDPHTKMTHCARVWGVYVTPASRGRGVGDAIIAAALGVARSWPGVASAGLSVSERSPDARRLYERHGFVAWGVEPDALRVDGRSYAEVHMRRPL